MDKKVMATEFCKKELTWVPLSAMGWCEMEELLKKMRLGKIRMGVMDAREKKDMPDGGL